MAGLMSQLAHKALIQTQMFVIECWKAILKTLADTLYPQRRVEIMEEHVPTPKPRPRDNNAWPRDGNTFFFFNPMSPGGLCRNPPPDEVEKAPEVAS